MRKILFLICLMCSLGCMAQEKIYMTAEKSGIYTIPCEVNGLKLRFVFDTGAADVSLSLVEAAFMMKNGYLDKTDITGTDTYSLADGSLSDNTIVNLKTIKIGSKTIHNVKACISSRIEASLLLGQSAIKKLGKYTIDGSILTLYPSSTSTSSSRTYANTNSSQTTNYSRVSTEEYSDGSYTGRFVNGKREGFGVYTYKEGDEYKGYFKNGHRHGSGVYKWKNGDQYDGEWVNSEISGFGTYKYAKTGMVYSGYWADEKWNGTGTLTWKNGEKYIGDFKNGNREGYGTYTWPSGAKYVGYFANNNRNGYGTYYYSNGKILRGQWKNGEYVGETSTSSSSSYGSSNNGTVSYTGTYDNSKRNSYTYGGKTSSYGKLDEGVFSNNDTDDDSNNSKSSFSGITPSYDNDDGILIYRGTYDRSSSTYGGSSSSSKSSNYGAGITSSYNPSEQSSDDWEKYVGYTTNTVNMRECADTYCDIVKVIPKNTYIFIDKNSEDNGFYKVIDLDTEEEGYISKKFVRFGNKIKKDNGNSFVARKSSSSPYALPVVTIQNNTNLTMTLRLGQEKYVINSNGNKKITLLGKKYTFLATAKGVNPLAGEKEFEKGHEYEWVFRIVTRKH